MSQPLQIIFATLFLFLSLPGFSQDISIYDAKKLRGFAPIFKPGELVIDKNVILKENLKPNILKLRDHFVDIYNYHFEMFHRDSWDGQGATIEAIVNLRGVLSLLGFKENASWYGAKSRFLFGYGKKLWGMDGFEELLDVVAHEYTHAIIDTTSELIYVGQSGAINEHLADVFGVLINKKVNNPENPFLIGLGLKALKPKQPLRNLSEPHKSLKKQPGHMKDLELPEFSQYQQPCKPTSQNDSCGVHILSGILNKMAVEVMTRLGDDLSSHIFYNVMTQRLVKDSDFKDYKEKMLIECQNYPQSQEDTCQIIKQAFENVGL